MSDITQWLAASHRAVRRAGGSRSALLRRRYDASITDVWSACTDRARLRRWFGDVTGELRLGAELTFDVGLGDLRTGGLPPVVTSKVLRCTAPTNLVITWSFAGDPRDPPDEVELRLATSGAETVLELEHRSTEAAPWATGVGAGWEAWLFRIDAVLAGTAPADFRSGLDEANARHAAFDPIWAALPEATGTLTRRAGRATLRFERLLAHPRERVWRAITDDLARWYPARLDGPLAPGAAVRFIYPDGSALDGSILTFDPPSQFAFTEVNDEARFELRAERSGTRLIFTHIFDDSQPAPSYAAGWEDCLAALDDMLAGRDPQPISDERRAALRAEYAASAE